MKDRLVDFLIRLAYTVGLTNLSPGDYSTVRKQHLRKEENRRIQEENKEVLQGWMFFIAYVGIVMLLICWGAWTTAD